jgi:Kef-type K+ transport systems, membrane components
MSELPAFFSDLALVFVTAGLTTVVFKWLKQPLVLGYIVAGFLIGPYFTYFPVISDSKSVEVWSEIGMVFLLFALGLEFSFKKLKKVGGTGAITAITELIIMFLVGSAIGKILGWSKMECIFLGCMLSISSTTIIVKAFDDLKLKKQKFTGTVIGVLVVEDLIAVLLLVILSTISVSQTFDGKELAFNLVKLAFFLIVWFVFGIFLIPSLLRMMRKFMTAETLVIVAVGLCFLMVVFANYAGFSSALGAFIMGSILAETLEAEIIHKLVDPIKNLFGAVFFVSVGMMVDPKILVQYAMPVLAISAAVVFVKSLSATTGMLLSGQDVKTAIQSGFCFCQIGEFSFIIASLGVSFGVVDVFLYPIIVTVSIVTTFLTPYMMKLALPCYKKVVPHIPAKWKLAFAHYASKGKSVENDLDIKSFLKTQVKNIVIYAAVIIAIILLSFMLLKPFLLQRIPAVWGGVIGAVSTLIFLMPFLWAMAFRHHIRREVYHALTDNRLNHGIFMSVLILRYLLALTAVCIVIGGYTRITYGFIMIFVVFIFTFFVFFRQVMASYKHIEKRFLQNLNQRQMQTSFIIPKILQQNFRLEKMVISPNSVYAGKLLHDTDFRDNYNISVVSVERGDKLFDLPSKDFQLFPFDKLTVVGSEDHINMLKSRVEIENDVLIREHAVGEMDMYKMVIAKNNPFYHLSLRNSGFQENYHAMVIAIERNTDFILNPSPSIVFEVNDVIWLVCSEKTAEMLHHVERLDNNTKRNTLKNK